MRSEDRDTLDCGSFLDFLVILLLLHLLHGRGDPSLLVLLHSISLILPGKRLQAALPELILHCLRLLYLLLSSNCESVLHLHLASHGICGGIARVRIRLLLRFVDLREWRQACKRVTHRSTNLSGEGFLLLGAGLHIDLVDCVLLLPGLMLCLQLLFEQLALGLIRWVLLLLRFLRARLLIAGAGLGPLESLQPSLLHLGLLLLPTSRQLPGPPLSKGSLLSLVSLALHLGPALSGLLPAGIRSLLLLEFELEGGITSQLGNVLSLGFLPRFLGPALLFALLRFNLTLPFGFLLLTLLHGELARALILGTTPSLRLLTLLPDLLLPLTSLHVYLALMGLDPTLSNILSIVFYVENVPGVISALPHAMSVHPVGVRSVVMSTMLSMVTLMLSPVVGVLGVNSTGMGIPVELDVVGELLLLPSPLNAASALRKSNSTLFGSGLPLVADSAQICLAPLCKGPATLENGIFAISSDFGTSLFDVSDLLVTSLADRSHSLPGGARSRHHPGADCFATLRTFLFDSTTLSFRPNLGESCALVLIFKVRYFGL